jgi:fatty-acyl-CoA synthase
VQTSYEPEVVDWIGYFAETTPDKIATIDLASNRRFSYAAMHDRVSRLAGYLREYGIKPGDRVAFLALNSTDILDIIFATWRLGGISLALNYRLTASELEYIVSDAGPEILFYDIELEGTVNELKLLADIKGYVALDGLGGDSPFEEVIKNGSPVTDMVPQTMADQCMLMYSSGTTGRPKGVIITHGMLFFSWVNGVSRNPTHSTSVWLSVMPIFHIGGLNVSCLPALWLGATTIVVRTFEPGAALDAFGDPELGVTHTICVPAMYNAMRMHPKSLTTDFSRMEAAIAGGASVPKELVEWWYERGLAIRDGYGMTESAASNSLLTMEDVPGKVGTSGKALMYTKMKVVDANGIEVPRGQPGEIWMKGPTITPGYWNNEAANAEAFVDGWFRSGDIARQDEGGYFIIEDRAKDMYISGGENVYPAEIEDVLGELEAIAEIAVIGVPDEKWGESGCAVVVVKSEYAVTLKDLQIHAASRLAKYKHPAHLVLLEALPRNATGKVKKFELRDMVTEHIG